VAGTAAEAKFGLKEAVVASCESSQEEDQLSTIGSMALSWSTACLNLAILSAFPGAGGSCAGRNAPAGQPVAAGDLRTDYRRPLGQAGKPVSCEHADLRRRGRLKAESHLADFPALLENTLIRNGIMQSQHFKTISSYWENLDVALVGIGSPAIRDGANWHAFYGSEESDDLNARHVAGDICSRFYDINGIAVETNMNEKRSPSILPD
jgi:DNA-binding transcriptional regulator LsrR (DeoR family)